MGNIDEEFLRQNPLTAEGLAIEDVEEFTADHAGGLVVLLRYLGDDLYVKLHDSWGGDETIVVHRYNADSDDPDNDPAEKVWEFTHALTALLFFKEVTA